MVKKKSIIFLITAVMIFVVITSLMYQIVVYSSSRSNGYTIVIDAGHGGRDGGSVGADGSIEKELNLAYSIELRDKLVENGYKVYMTRSTDDGLYSEFDKNKKVSDMNKRMEIIKKANPNLVISIHMNSFQDRSVSGAMTFYRCDDESSRVVGDLIQKSLKLEGLANTEKSKVGDYFMVNCSYYTSVLIECGFISNPEEEKKLITDEHRSKIINAIYHGVLMYFGNYEIV